MSIPGKPLPDLSEAEVRELLRLNAASVQFGYNDLIRELDRWAANRQARWSLILSVLGVLIAVAAILVAVLRPASG